MPEPVLATTADARAWALENSDLSIEQIAARAGFGTSAALRHHLRATLGTSPMSYRRTFQA